MKHKFFFIAFMLVWVILILWNLFFPKQLFSEQENRYLAKFPQFSWEDLVSGTFSENLDTYINDHFVFRDQWLKVKSSMEVAVGKQENNGVYIGKDGYLFEKFTYENEQEENVKKAAKIINEFASKTNLPTYFALIPNSIYINQEKLPDNVFIYDQSDIIDFAYQNTAKVKTIETVSILKKYFSLPIYFKTDHHMTSTGSYLIYTEFCKSAQIKPVLLSDFEKVTVSTEFLGTFDSKAQIAGQQTDEIVIYKNDKNTSIEEVNQDGVITYSIYGDSYLQTKDKYSYFLNGNHAKSVVKTKVKNGKKLLVIKDSYAHNWAQFLCQHFEEIHFVDPRYYNASLSNYAKEEGITETLFLYNVANFVNDIGIRNVK